MNQIETQMKKIILLVVFFAISTKSIGQLSYAKKNVEILASHKMKGRGYVKNGNKKAAKYIRGQFKKNNLISFEKNYFQYFETPVNTQPSKLKIILNDSLKLIPGVDFIISPSSPSLKGTFETVLLKAKDFLNSDIFLKKLKHATDKALLIDVYNLDLFSKKEKQHILQVIDYIAATNSNDSAAIFIFTSEKLTWSGSTKQSEIVLFRVNKKIDLKLISEATINTKSTFYKNYKTQNIIGYLEGSSALDSTIVISAHYDHLGMMGSKTIFSGANDNASGVALLLDLAKHYSIETNRPKYNLIFIAFGGEEIGLIGSKYYTEHPVSPLKKIKFMLNFDLAGTGDEGIKVVNSKQFPLQFQKLNELNSKHMLLPKIEPRGAACNSDHCYFYQKNVPAFYTYTLGGIQSYHDIYDVYETLPFTEFENYSNLIKLFINSI